MRATETGRNNEDGKTQQDCSWFLSSRSQEQLFACWLRGLGGVSRGDRDPAMHSCAGGGGEVLLCRTAEDRWPCRSDSRAKGEPTTSQGTWWAARGRKGGRQMSRAHGREKGNYVFPHFIPYSVFFIFLFYSLTLDYKLWVLPLWHVFAKPRWGLSEASFPCVTATQTQLDSSGGTKDANQHQLRDRDTDTSMAKSQTQKHCRDFKYTGKQDPLTWKTSDLHRCMWKTKCFNPSIKNNSSNYFIGYINIDP